MRAQKGTEAAGVGRNPARPAASHPMASVSANPAHLALQHLQRVADQSPRTVALRKLTQPGTASALQRVRITKAELGDAIWDDIVDELYLDDETEFDTAALDEDKRESIAGLIQPKDSALAERIRSEAPAPPDQTDTTPRTALDVLAPDDEAKDELVRRRTEAQDEKDTALRAHRDEQARKAASDVTPPAYEKLATIWSEDYGKRYKEYRGKPDVVFAALAQDPAIEVLFPAVATFAHAIGWSTLGKTTATITSPDVMVQLNFFGGSQFNVHGSFPLGWQDTNFHFSSGDGGETFKIYAVHRHRSTKTEGAPANTFIGVVAEQAAAVHELGTGQENPVHYDSDAIRDPSSGGIGYNVWPKMGFDAEVPDTAWAAIVRNASTDEKFAKARVWLESAKPPVMLSDLLGQAGEAGAQLKDLWREHGETVNAVFDPKPGSKSWTTLAKYAESKGGSLPQAEDLELP